MINYQGERVRNVQKTYQILDLLSNLKGDMLSYVRVNKTLVDIVEKNGNEEPVRMASFELKSGQLENHIEDFFQNQNIDITQYHVMGKDG
mmetsp:Transcript_41662/g.37057  ORF Transcript_41662/g.37057 Transcript_41662/m.37057 type:complete len:90 (+) Transcript_41662:1095-1364(+)